jgi:two-component system, NarL family, sensor histidine kinase BarA
VSAGEQERLLLKSLFRSWSLESKCLLFLGLALLVSLVLGFFAVQFVAERLVIEATRQSARDYANAVIGLKHVAWNESSPGNDDSTSNTANQSKRTELMRTVRQSMLESRFEFSIFRINDRLEHRYLDNSIATEGDLSRLVEIHASLAYQDTLASEAAEEEAKRISGSSDGGPSAGPSDLESIATKEVDRSRLPPATNPLSNLANPTKYVYRDAGPIDGFYYYYHPVAFNQTCLICHAKLPASADIPSTPSTDPFRVVRVKLPYSETRVWRIWSYSLLTSIGIATLATGLFFIHWVVKRLVINPLSELKLVSEEITSGKTGMQFRVDTDDEFSELSESFNRMLRHLIETQTQLETVNRELDLRVDDLASLNLQLFEANKLKGEFLASMSHELRTPLNSILGFSDVLQGIETLTDKQRRYVSNIQNSGRVLLEMINDILDLAKVEAGKMAVRSTEFCVLSVLRDQVEIFRKMAEDKNIDLQIDSNQSELLVVQDQPKLAQILTNLLSNAIKFTPEGGLVTIACDRTSDENFSITIADTGVGIAPSDHEVIFEKFRQASPGEGRDALTREHTGTGLGLSIVRELCRLLGGDITLTSQLGHGSTFCVTLPIHYRPPSSGTASRTQGI